MAEMTDKMHESVLKEFNDKEKQKIKQGPHSKIAT